jgi:hypothetical protein
MVRKARLSIAGLMGVVLVASLGLTAFRSATEEWAGATTLVTGGVLVLGVVGAACRRGAERAWWLGFALFGWGYLFLIFGGTYTSLHLPTTALLEMLRPSRAPSAGGPVGGMGGGTGFPFPPFSRFPFDAFSQVGQSLFALAFAVVGGLLGVFLFGARSVRARAVVVSVPKAHAPRSWWRRIAVAASVVVTSSVVVLAGLRWAPGPLCAATMFVTWGLLGLIAVGAACRPRRARAVWLGAALFGIGYMSLMFGRVPERIEWPRAGTDLLLRAIRPSWYVNQAPPSTVGTAVTNAWIHEVLTQPIAMRYPNGIPLEEALAEIQVATKGPGGRGLSFYVDPIGLQEAEKTMQSPIAINLEGAPLRTTLRLILKQLDLTYAIQDGVVLITSEKAGEEEPFSVGVDPYLSVGHCLLALLAAGLGAVLARWFCAPREELAARPMSI